MYIAGHLRLVRLLAEGGMGTVWVAEHAGLKAHVAVKFLSVSGGNTLAESRFAQEAATAARIKSPHVVQTFDHGIGPDGVPFLVMELLEGETLGARLKRRQRLTLLETGAILVQTSRALTSAHAADFVHRDIKPDNLFLTDSAGELFLKVLDFGIAKDRGEGASGMTQTGVAMGTPFYMSPEQLVSAKSVGMSSDLWALAVTAYRCLTGTLPFQGETYGALAIAIGAGKFTPPTRLRADLPETLDAWFTRALDLDQNQRFPSAKALGESFVLAAGLSVADVSVVLSGFGPEVEAPPSDASRLGVFGRSLTHTAHPEVGARSSPSLGGTASNVRDQAPRAPTRWRPSRALLGLAVAALVASLATGLLLNGDVWRSTPPAPRQLGEVEQFLEPPAEPAAQSTAAQQVPLLPAAESANGGSSSLPSSVPEGPPAVLAVEEPKAKAASVVDESSSAPERARRLREIVGSTRKSSAPAKNNSTKTSPDAVQSPAGTGKGKNRGF
jgi:eukaryotic-like serine/threonine-protein kinase